jgi:hypothetical protein
MNEKIKITDENFVKLSAWERLDVIVGSTYRYLFIFAIVTAALSWIASFPFLAQLQGPGTSYAGDRAALREAASVLEQASVALRPGGDYSKGLALVDQSKQLITQYLAETAKRRAQFAPSDFSAFVGVAYAQEKTPAIPNEARRWILGGVMLTLAVVFVGSLVSIFLVKDSEILRFAFDTIKTLMGFFIGVATTLIGSS